MTREQFLNLSADEQNVFLSKLHHAIRNDEDSFNDAFFIVKVAEITGVFRNVKFGNEIYNDAETDLQLNQI
jgi:hypothetical protein